MMGFSFPQAETRPAVPQASTKYLGIAKRAYGARIVLIAQGDAVAVLLCQAHSEGCLWQCYLREPQLASTQAPRSMHA